MKLGVRLLGQQVQRLVPVRLCGAALVLLPCTHLSVSAHSHLACSLEIGKLRPYDEHSNAQQHLSAQFYLVQAEGLLREALTPLYVSPHITHMQSLERS